MAPRGPQILAVAAVVLVISALAFGAWAASPRSLTPDQRETAAAELLTGIRVIATVRGSSLVATEAIADFGIGKTVGLVRVRIVDGLGIDLRIEAARDVSFAELLQFCLVGPFSAPDDAGLSDRCWGEPDLAAAVAARLPADSRGDPTIRAGQPLTLSVMLHRGDVRCDYPPGNWVLEIRANPLIDGTPVGARYLPDVNLHVPWATDGLLQLRADTRYCGLADGPYQEQGEPPVKTP